MREETVNRRITNAVDEIPLEPLRNYLKNRIRFERSKMDRDQPYFKNSYRDATTDFAPEDPTELDEYNVESLTAAALSGELQRNAGDYESDPIQIFEIQLNNWRQYGGEQRIDLGVDGERLINIIEGENGAGKSNLLNAITLCFYGKEVQEQSDNEDLNQLPFINRAQLEDSEPGETNTGHIEVVLGVHEPEYLFRREFETTIEEDGSFDDTVGDLELRRKSGGEWKRTDSPSTYLNQVLPANVADYFLFDGEDLDGFFNEGYPRRIENAIFDVSHLELLNRAIDHLKKIRSDIESEASDVEGEAAEIRDEVAAIEDELEAKHAQLESVREEINETQENIHGINNKLKDVSDEYVKRRYDEREELKDRVEDLEKRQESLDADIKDLLVDLGPTLYGADAMLEAYDELAEMSEAESIPPKIQRRFISEMLERGKCICGRPVEAHSEEEEHLEELQESVFDVAETQLNDSSQIPNFFETANEQMQRLIEKRQELARVEDEIDDSKKQIQNITDELKAHEIPDDVDISTLESNREELEDDLEKLREKRARLQIELEDLEDDLDEVQAELQAELSKQEEHKELRAELALVNLAEGCLETIRNDILSELRNLTEENLDQYFNELIWKQEEYNLVLADDYSVSVLDEYGDNKIGSLSAGETQVLALSFMAALTEISGFDAPVVIDTPLGRISSTPKHLIAQNLPKYMEDTQITFLMTDEEYTDDVQEALADAVQHEYQLVYSDNKTKIVARDTAQEVDV